MRYDRGVGRRKRRGGEERAEMMVGLGMRKTMLRSEDAVRQRATTARTIVHPLFLCVWLGARNAMNNQSPRCPTAWAERVELWGSRESERGWWLFRGGQVGRCRNAGEVKH